MKTEQMICEVLKEGPATSLELSAEIECGQRAVKNALGRLESKQKVRRAGSIADRTKPFILWELTCN